jgi:predicted nucleic-acid-binding Zn-ribbon protein
MEEEPMKKPESGCPECGNLTFRHEEARTTDRAIDFTMIKCEHCNAVVGIYDKSIPDLLDEIKAILAAK